MVNQKCNPRVWETREGSVCLEFKARPGYIVSSRLEMRYNMISFIKKYNLNKGRLCNQKDADSYVNLGKNKTVTWTC